MKALLRILLLTAAPCWIAAQTDSSLLLSPERLGEKDILFRDLSQQDIKVISATRSPEVIDQQPFTVWVITGEEILRYGFVTLGDVLRAAPGVRVSQPGNAVEGETFLMRGLPGNQYVKVLINDVPVKPGVALGMPIGAQLPIRQAERIEVMYGPASAIYGDEAAAGVVNIILKETERPVFTQADLSFGPNSYNSLDLMFGGKLGRDKNIFRYSIYGSSTVREDSDYYYDKNLFNTNNYLSLQLDTSLYRSFSNYRGADAPKDSFARTGALPHESRLFGINMTWRGLHFTYHRLARFDRSALGLNPLAVSYANPSNRLAERLETFSIGFQRRKKHRTAYNTFSFVNYRINSSSSTTYVFDRLSSAAFAAYGGPNLKPDEQKTLLREIYSYLASDERYAIANGIDGRIESRVSASMSTKSFLDLGAQFGFGAGVPLSTYLPVPLEVSLDGLLGPAPPKTIYPASNGYLNANLFAQYEWRGRRLHFIGATSLTAAIEYGFVFSPRAGAVYRIDSTWSVRVNAARGFKQPSLYGQANSFLMIPPTGLQITAGGRVYDLEYFTSGEAGVRFKRDFGGSELFAFWQQCDNLYRPGYFVSENGIVESYSYGFKNAPGLAQTLWGFQLMHQSTSREWLTIGGPRKYAKVSSKTEFHLQYVRGREYFGYGLPNTREVLNQPKWTLQFRTFFKINKNVEVMVAANHQSSSLRKSVIYRDFYQLAAREDRMPRYTTWDLVGRVYLSNHFQVYCNFQNIFDREFAGLDATGTVDDLLYNPQPGRFVRFGVNYNMN